MRTMWLEPRCGIGQKQVVVIDTKPILCPAPDTIDKAGEVLILFIVQRDGPQPLNDHVCSLVERRPDTKMHTPSQGCGADGKPPLDDSRHSVAPPSFSTCKRGTRHIRAFGTAVAPIPSDFPAQPRSRRNERP